MWLIFTNFIIPKSNTKTKPMIPSAVHEYAQSFGTPLVLEYFFGGERIVHPSAFFEANQELLENAFPSQEEIVSMINKYAIYSATHKLVISEYGFHLIHL